MRRACDALARAGLIVKIGVGWALPPETQEEATARRKRNRTSKRDDDQFARSAAFTAAVFDTAITVDPTTRRKLVKVLGMLASAHDGEVLADAKQAERLRAEIGCGPI